MENLTAFRAITALRAIQELVDKQSDDSALWIAPRVPWDREEQRRALKAALMEIHDMVERFTIPLFEKGT